MAEIINYITSNWAAWFCAAISAIFGFGYRKIVKQQKLERIKSVAISEGVQALLRDRIIQAYNHYKDIGYCPIYAKENVKRMYSAYHSLGGNDVATKLKDELLEMPTEKER
ncbi:hypothetical protein [Murimonas intestini]|uniref:hypothetical protein n=1 Tax=Murimonas intestini TaxID=1337051 RepID=UPI00248B58FD|nr:hypothetical protein [Murimonas intestini]